MGHTITTIFFPRSCMYCQRYSGYPMVWFCLSTALSTVQWRMHRERDSVAFLERKVSDFIPPTLWPPNSLDLNPIDYSIWSVLQEKVYRSRIANVNELETHLIDEWER